MILHDQKQLPPICVCSIVSDMNRTVFGVLKVMLCLFLSACAVGSVSQKENEYDTGHGTDVGDTMWADVVGTNGEPVGSSVEDCARLADFITGTDLTYTSRVQERLLYVKVSDYEPDTRTCGASVLISPITSKKVPTVRFAAFRLSDPDKVICWLKPPSGLLYYSSARFWDCDGFAVEAPEPEDGFSAESVT